MSYTQGDMTDRTEYYNQVNRKTPVVPFRAPSRGHLEQIEAAAEAAGVTRSEWIRKAVSRALEDLTNPSTETDNRSSQSVENAGAPNVWPRRFVRLGSRRRI